MLRVYHEDAVKGRCPGCGHVRQLRKSPEGPRCGACRRKTKPAAEELPKTTGTVPGDDAHPLDREPGIGLPPGVEPGMSSLLRSIAHFRCDMCGDMLPNDRRAVSGPFVACVDCVSYAAERAGCGRIEGEVRS